MSQIAEDASVSPVGTDGASETVGSVRSIAADSPAGLLTPWLSRSGATTFSAYCIVAAFGTYFCMYAFRKPFTAGTFAELSLWGIGYKTVLVMSQVAGYTLSKFLGIKYVSEMPPAGRAWGILVLIGIAEAALLAFAIVPAPYNFPFLFINGLPLGMVFGLVLSFLEGRRVTEALSAGLCASFILSSGFVKSVGASLIVSHGVSEFWMPVVTGALFVPPLLLFVYMLKQIPKPNELDEQHRSVRTPMNGQARWDLFWRHRWGLSGLVFIYLLLTIGRTIRDDYAVEIWAGLGYTEQPSIFAWSELVVTIGVTVVTGLAFCIRSNRLAFLTSLGLIAGGFATVLGCMALFESNLLDPFWFMVLVGFGLYVPYVAFHTTVFERFIAVFREPGNLGYLMYLADAIGYLAYVGLLVFKELFAGNMNYLLVFKITALLMSLISTVVVVSLMAKYSGRLPRDSTPASLNA